MKYSKTTLMELSHKYRSILKRCAFLNAAILLSAAIALPAGATTITERQEISVDTPFVDAVTASEVTTTSSLYGAVLYNNTGITTTFENTVNMTDNTNNWVGGAIANGGTSEEFAGGTILFEDAVDFTHNTSVHGAGAIFNLNGQVTFSEAANFERNETTGEGNGGAIESKGASSNITFEKAATFTQNTADTYGGAIHNEAGNITFEGTSTFSGNKSILGGAINNSGTIIYNDLATFDGNYTSDGSNGGVIYNHNGNITFNKGLKTYGNGSNADKTVISGTNISNVGGNLNILGGNVDIRNNFAKQGAGLVNVELGTTVIGSSDAALEQVLFDNNETSSTGGAIYNGASSTMTIYADTVKLTNNKTTAGYAGGIGNMAATINVYGANNTFDSNKSLGSVAVDDANEYKYGGGAIQNNAGTVVIGLTDGSSTNTFKNNESAMHGGAILSRGSGAFTINGNTLFENNIAAVNGGAIHNIKGSTMTFNGNTVFKNNKANGVLNDIYNAGTITFNGDVTLDGGVVNAGILIFKSGTTLTLANVLNGSTIISGGTIHANGALLDSATFVVSEAGEYTFADGTIYGEFGVSDNLQTAIDKNLLYDITYDKKGTFTVAEKDAADIAKDVVAGGATAQEAGTIAAVADADSTHPIIGAITQALQTGNVAAVAEAAKELAPTTSQQVMGIAQGINGLLSNVTGGRMAALGKSGGDAFIGGSTWVQGLYNHSKQDASGANAGFSANTKGIAFGIDGKANEALTLGIGYGYTRTDASSQGRKVDVDGHNIFVYGQYQPEQFYVNTMLSYGFSEYTEKKNPMGVAMKAKYDVNTFAANVMTGYDFTSGITPEGGLRYLRADQETYNDGAQQISTDASDVLTAVAGVKYTTDVKTENWTFKPTLRLAATYDVKSDNSKANVNVIGGGNYQITGDRLHRFGVETGVGVTSTVKNWDLTLEYNGGFRKDFQSHTGMLKAKYNF